MDALAHNVPAAVLNNIAIAYLQADRPHEAMELLQIALSKLRDEFVLKQEPEQDISSADPIQENDDMSMATDDHSEPCSKPSSSISVFGSVPVWMQRDTSFLTFYDRALLVDVDSPCQEHELLSAVILFNMALLHHSRGIDCGKAEFLERASRLYRIALDILQKQACYGTNYLLLMALFNNLAHIDSHLFRLDEMKDSLEEMCIILTSDDIEDEDFPLEEDDYAIFFMNAMMGNEREFTVAAAA